MQNSGPKEQQRIAKLLARAGVASRREIERMIAEGRIAIDGVRVDTPATLLTSLRGVTVDGEAVKDASPARLFLFNKPAGTLTAAVDYNGRKTIYDVLPNDLPRLMPVGRLDLNTEGLLLLTTDGELKRQLELPATGVERSYRARAYGDVTQAQLEELIEGVEFDGVRYGPIDANLERRTGANVWVEMVLTEGKNREVRRVLEYLGLQVSRLIRTRYGPFVLGDLPVGGIGEVRQVDLIQFRASLKGNKAKAVEEARANPVAVRVPQPKPAPQPEADAPPPRAERKPPAERRVTLARQNRADEPVAAAPRPTRAPMKAGAAAATGRRTPTPLSAPEHGNGGRSDRTRPERPDRAARAARAARAERPAKAYEGRETRDDLATARPRSPRPDGDAAAPKPRPKRGAGWAKAKPKPRPGKPRKPRA
ncbi:pseudouridine synthase [Sphingomonas floccifaciens]|uniref:Pseudouridine synthase n=1 Tax=Sphingomonas floccifaciens TaxID=1844115 RepID=A0ABW4NAV3_9SPHN